MIVTRPGVSAWGDVTGSLRSYAGSDLCMTALTVQFGAQCFTRLPEKYQRSMELAVLPRSSMEIKMKVVLDD